MSSPLLKPGDQVALVCTGTPCESVQDAQLSVDYLAQQLNVSAHYRHDTYQSLPAAQRAEIFWDYLTNPAISAIWSVRGGEGTADLIPFLASRHRIMASLAPKLLIGFSDFTPMLVYFRQHYNWPTLHGVGARQLPRKMVHARTEQMTLNWLSNPESSLELMGLKPLNLAACVDQCYSAEVVGGNLTLLSISVADLWQLRPAGRIILLEEVNEEPYKASRTLKYLSRIHFFDGAEALILAGFDFPGKSTLENQHRSQAMHVVLREFAETLNIPVFFTDEVGHGKSNLPIPFYVKAHLQGGYKATCRFSKV